jgi:hypothetical protein
MKELESLCHNFAERRVQQNPTESERRKGFGLARRAGQARVAYLMQMHRLNCMACRYHMSLCG